MTVKIEEATREQVAVFVPEALRKALGSYHDFMDREIDSDPKKFSEHHTAGKVALAHVQLILKLAEWANVKSGIDEDAVRMMLVAAKAEVTASDENEQDFPE